MTRAAAAAPNPLEKIGETFPRRSNHASRAWPNREAVQLVKQAQKLRGIDGFTREL